MKRIAFPILILLAVLFIPQGFSYLTSDALAKKYEGMGLKEAMYYEKLDDKQVRCMLCPRRCVIPNRRRGFCKVRENRNGTLYTVVYAKPCAVHIDPIEKKPLFHVLPGTKSYSIATAGCNLACKFCQNWQISQAYPEELDSEELLPLQVVNYARMNNCPTIAYTYTEPTVFYEYMIDTAKIAHEKGVMNVMHSAGFINEEPLRELCKYMDAANIDLKGSDKFYDKFCFGRREDVLRTLKILKEEGVWVEITYLMIPTVNDDEEYIRKTAKWIRENLGQDVPFHISRFWPTYKMKNLSPTPIEALKSARKIAMEEGLNYVYVGNAPGNKGEITYCPKCKNDIIERMGYNIFEYNLKDGKCKYCGEKIAGIWKKQIKL